MKLLLVQPKTEGFYNFPPLGLGYLATLAAKGGHKVRIIDLEVEKLSDEQLLKKVSDFCPDLVGFTSTIRSKKEALRLAELLSAYNIVFGGPQATSEPEAYLQAMRNSKKVYVLKGECEKSMMKLLKYISGNLEISQVTNLVYFEKNRYIENQIEPVVINLDELPIVDRRLYNLPLYFSKLYGKKATNIITSRGCPFRCSFCFHDFHGKIYRQRSAENIIKEIHYLMDEFQCRGFVIYDDNFTVNRVRLEKLCHYFIEKKLRIVWRCLSRVNVMDEEIMTLMKRAGCKEIAFGIESGSEDTLRRINKMITLEQSEKVMGLCRKLGIVSKAYMMIGFPWETKVLINETIDFACKILPYEAQFSVLTPLPNTEIYKQTVEMGYAIDANFDFTRFTPCFETENFTKNEIIEIQNVAEKKLKKAQLKYILKHPFSHFAFFHYENTVRMFYYKIKKLTKFIIWDTR